MKNYYYKEFKVRSSISDNDYKFALLYKENRTIKTIKCSKTRENCVKYLDYLTKAESYAKRDNITIEEAYMKYKLISNQRAERKNYIIVELEQR